jgi:hypothetical protein
MALVQTKQIADNPRRYYREVRSGTRTAGDFDVVLGFIPLKVEVTNATDRISAIWHSDVLTPNALQLLTVADGTRTYADAGITVTGMTVNVDISDAALESDNDVTIIEAWG